MKCEELFGMYITSPSGVQRSLSKIIRECVSIEVSEMEPSYVSKFICNGCVYKLEQFYAFRQQSLKCQEYYNGNVVLLPNNDCFIYAIAFTYFFLSLVAYRTAAILSAVDPLLQ